MGAKYPHPSRSTLGPTQPPIQWEPNVYPGVKPVERAVDNPPTSNIEVKE